MFSGDGAASAARAPLCHRGGAAGLLGAVAGAARGAPPRRPRRRPRVPHATLLSGAPPMLDIRLIVLGFIRSASEFGLIKLGFWRVWTGAEGV